MYNILDKPLFILPHSFVGVDTYLRYICELGKKWHHHHKSSSKPSMHMYQVEAYTKMQIVIEPILAYLF